MMVWICFPRSRRPQSLVTAVDGAFASVVACIDSSSLDLESNAVLAAAAIGLSAAGFRVESGKSAEKKILVPVLFGSAGRTERSFDLDAWHEAAGFVVEVEAGRAVANNQLLKDLFQCCMMVGVVEAASAVRKTYRNVNDYEKGCRFFETLYTSSRLQLFLNGVLLIGY